jgi:dephospho-CoA kinase
MLGDALIRPEIPCSRPVRLVGITGNSGCGQSTAAAFASGFCDGVCSLDVIGHRLLDRSYVASDLALRLCRPDLLRLRGTELRRELGRTAFSDPALMDAVNSVMHPRMLGWARTSAARLRTLRGLWVLEGALIVELGLAPMLDRLIVVRDTIERCAARVTARDGVPETETALRWKMQLPLETKASMADWVIDNAGSKADMRTRIDSIFAGMNRPD